MTAHWTESLSARAQNILITASYDFGWHHPPSKTEVRRAIQQGQLDPAYRQSNPGTRNYGKKIDAELRKAVGLPPRPKGRPQYFSGSLCPNCKQPLP